VGPTGSTQERQKLIASDIRGWKAGSSRKKVGVTWPAVTGERVLRVAAYMKMVKKDGMHKWGRGA